MTAKRKTSRTRPAHKTGSLLAGAPNSRAKIWLLTLDGAHARIYSVASDTGRPVIVPGGAFKQRSLPNRHMVSDRPGHRGFAGTGRRHALAQRSDPHTRAETSFVKSVAAYVNTAAREKRFDHLIIAAPPKAIKDVRDALNATTRKKVVVEITHEWMKLGIRELGQRLRAALAPAD